MASYPVIRLKAREGRRVRAGAPWVFSNEVTMSEAAKALAPGSTVNIAGDDGREFGTFYFNPRSLITARQLDRAAGADIDAAFLEARLRRALALREQIYPRPYYRLVHAEGDLLPGLVIDRFDDTLSVQIATAGMEALTEPLLEALDRVLAPQAVILRNDVPARTLEGLDSYVRVVKGAPARVTVEENAIRYFADLASGQKTGWYYDQRDNRAFAA